MINHYKWLEQNLLPFRDKLNIPNYKMSLGIISHGDKCYQYMEMWRNHNIPFQHGVLIYLLSYVEPYSRECRELPDGKWISPGCWVRDNYNRFKPYIPE